MKISLERLLWLFYMDFNCISFPHFQAAGPQTAQLCDL